MTISEVLNNANKVFHENNIENYFYETRELLAFLLNKTKEWIMMNLDTNLSLEEENKFNNLISKRISGTPFQYIIGYQYFFSNKFFVNENVLIPRADTEILIYKVLEIAKSRENIRILDMCTGSGCIAISLSKELEKSCVFAVDISKDALDVAYKNSIENGVSVNFIESDLFSNVPSEKFDIIVSNPPYIMTSEMSRLSKDVLNEPHIALDGGEDGLVFYRNISKDSRHFLTDGGYIVFEIGYDEGEAVYEILNNLEYSNIEIIKDYSGNDRVVVAKK